MSEIKLNCEQLLATTRQHFFSSDQNQAFPDGLADDHAASRCGEPEHQTHAGR